MTEPHLTPALFNRHSLHLNVTLAVSGAMLASARVQPERMTLTNPQGVSR